MAPPPLVRPPEPGICNGILMYKRTARVLYSAISGQYYYTTITVVIRTMTYRNVCMTQSWGEKVLSMIVRSSWDA